MGPSMLLGTEEEQLNEINRTIFLFFELVTRQHSPGQRGIAYNLKI